MSYETFGEWVGRRKHDTGKMVEFFLDFSQKRWNLHQNLQKFTIYWPLAEKPRASVYFKGASGGGQWHAGRSLLGAWGAVLHPVQKPGLGHQPLLPGGLRRPHRLLGGPKLPKSPAPCCAGTPGARPRGPTSGGGRGATGALSAPRDSPPPSPPAKQPPPIAP